MAIIKGEECESSYSDGGVSIAEPSTSAMEQVHIDETLCNQSSFMSKIFLIRFN